jgi:hypothetical protein
VIYFGWVGLSCATDMLIRLDFVAVSLMEG